MSDLPTVGGSRETPWGLTIQQTLVLQAIGDRQTMDAPTHRDALAELYPHDWLALGGMYVETYADGELVRLTPLGVAVYTWSSSRDTEERRAAKREHGELVRRYVASINPALLTMNLDELSAHLRQLKARDAELRQTVAEAHHGLTTMWREAERKAKGLPPKRNIFDEAENAFPADYLTRLANELDAMADDADE